MVVEITPIGIQNLQWKFYVCKSNPQASQTPTVTYTDHGFVCAQIIWTVLNLSFVPLVYFFYVETAGRTLEDIDTYFREHHNVIVFRDTVSPSLNAGTLKILIAASACDVFQTPARVHP
jgi:hypothetical protein